jgi:hypothetical protein
LAFSSPLPPPNTPHTHTRTHTVVAENFIVALPSLAPSTARAIDILYWSVLSGLWCLLHILIGLGAASGGSTNLGRR